MAGDYAGISLMGDGQLICQFLSTGLFNHFVAFLAAVGWGTRARTLISGVRVIVSSANPLWQMVAEAQIDSMATR